MRQKTFTGKGWMMTLLLMMAIMTKENKIVLRREQQIVQGYDEARPQPPTPQL
jgi:hypothetical protein